MKHIDMKAMPERMRLLLLLAITLSLLVPMPAATAVSIVPPPPTSAHRSGCPSMCGNVSIPYPFGIGDDCAWPGSENFTVICNHSYIPPRPYYLFYNKTYEIINISVETGEMRVFSEYSYVCFNSFNTTHSMYGWHLNATSSPFLVSTMRNQFTAIGGNTLAFMEGREDLTYYTGCITSSITLDVAAQDGDDCTGLGCCQTMVAGNLSYVHIYWKNNLVKNPINNAWEYSPCGYAFLAEKGWYIFSRRDLLHDGNDTFASRVGDHSIPVVLDWAFRNGSCHSASACVSPHSYCVNATEGPGYVCSCSKGYTGNPYVIGPDGCTNIDECTNNNNPCGKDSTCKDTDGGFNCECNFNHKGDGKSVRGCDEYVFPPYAIAAVATVPAVILASFAIIVLQTRKQRKLFYKNGGDILKGVGINIFTNGELKAITKNYSNRLGGGFFGDVYMGTIEDGAKTQHVAVKCTVAKKLARVRQNVLRSEAPQHEQEESWKDGFVKEITFQFQIKHPNVVRLIGCCLETDVPILVFEYVSNGSLHDKLHVAKNSCISLLERLDIAIGSAQALSHIHCHGEYNHVHGDIKPANILLDENLEAKVSDFGSSKLLSANKYVVDVATDGNYADPVYYKTGKFTVKSDVYSFGVVLLELITRKTSRYGENRSLPIDFEKSWKDEDERSMYDASILSDDPLLKKCLHMVGTLAVQCLNIDADKRPTMGEVLVELKKVKAYAGTCLEAPIEDEASKQVRSA